MITKAQADTLRRLIQADIKANLAVVRLHRWDKHAQEELTAEIADENLEAYITRITDDSPQAKT